MICYTCHLHTSPRHITSPHHLPTSPPHITSTHQLHTSPPHVTSPRDLHTSPPHITSRVPPIHTQCLTVRTIYQHWKKILYCQMEKICLPMFWLNASAVIGITSSLYAGATESIPPAFVFFSSAAYLTVHSLNFACNLIQFPIHLANYIQNSPAPIKYQNTSNTRRGTLTIQLETINRRKTNE